MLYNNDDNEEVKDTFCNNNVDRANIYFLISLTSISALPIYVYFVLVTNKQIKNSQINRIASVHTQKTSPNYEQEALNAGPQ